MSSRIGSRARPVRIAIIGAGPSGFYAAGALLEQNDIEVSIDIFDRLITPYGLVRHGVAPDHQKIKSVTRIYEKTAKDSRVRFFGHVAFGKHLTHEEFRRFYDQIVYAVGSPTDRRLNIPGEDLIGSEPATIFVAWYNGHPDYAHWDYDVSGESVAVVGNGNVAMDVARILAKAHEELGKTDIADHALDVLRGRAVRNIYMLGRRGPAQAAFTNPELRELGELSGVDVMIDPAELELDPVSAQYVADNKEATRNLRTLRELAERGDRGNPVRLYLRFLVSPVEILGEHGQVTAVRLERNRLDENMKARGTGVYETLPIGMILRAVGYNGEPIPGVPFDSGTGTIPNRQGRVMTLETGHPVAGEYVVGWAKRGPTGVIGTNKTDAVETVKRMLEDVPFLAPVDAEDADPAAADAYIRKRQPEVATFRDWQHLNSLEEAAGQAAGRPRVKFVRVQEMLARIAEATGDR